MFYLNFFLLHSTPLRHSGSGSEKCDRVCVPSRRKRVITIYDKYDICRRLPLHNEVTIMLLCRYERKDSSKVALSCCSPPASPGVEGEIYLWHFSTLLCNYVTEVATNVYPFRPADHRGRTEQHHESVLGHNNFPRTMTNLSEKMAARSRREKTRVRNYFRFCSILTRQYLDLAERSSRDGQLAREPPW